MVIGLNLESAAILLTGGFIMLGLGTVTAALLTVADALAGIGARPGGGALSESPSLAPAPGDKGWPGNYGRRKSKTGGDMPGFLRPARGGPTAGGAPRPRSAWGRPVAAVARRAVSRQAPPRKSEPVPPVITTTIDPGVPKTSKPRSSARRQVPIVPIRPSLSCRPGRQHRSPPRHRGGIIGRAGAGGVAGHRGPALRRRGAAGARQGGPVLSDGTVEAETAEGWMRFENVEHLEEYLQAMGEV